MLLKRILVTLTLGPLVLLLIYLGGLFYFIPFLLLLSAATVEYSGLMRHLGFKVSPFLILPFVAALLVDGQWPELRLTIPLLIAATFVTMFAALWMYEANRSETAAADWLTAIAGILLLGAIGSYFFRVRGIPAFAVEWTMMAMVGTWLADSGAYVAGKSLGRHKLAPRLSPNKTVEGYVGGIIAGTLVTLIMGWLLGLPWLPSLLLGLAVSVISPAGDLGISLLKRQAGVKDSGHLFPGHGGALDRIDSLIWSVTFATFLAALL